jgi:hypothetical protein
MLSRLKIAPCPWLDEAMPNKAVQPTRTCGPRG